MHVGIVTPTFPWPASGRNVGIERLAKQLFTRLAATGNDVSVITTFWNGGTAHEDFGPGQIFRTKDTTCLFGRWAAIGDSHYWSWGFRVFGVLRTVRPDVVHSLAPLASTPALAKC